MKKTTKILLALAMVGSAPLMASCGAGVSDVVDSATAAIITSALDSINLEERYESGSSFNTPTRANGGVTLTWASNNSEVVIFNGTTASVVGDRSEDKTVVVTVTATKDEVSASRDFTIIVAKRNVNYNISTVAEVLANQTGKEVYVEGIVTQLIFSNSSYSTPGSFYLTDATGSIYVYGAATAQKLSQGDRVVIKGQTAAYPTSLGRVTQIASPDLVETVSSNNSANVNLSSLTKKTVAELNADLENDAHIAKTYYLENVIIDKYVTSYTSYSIFDNKDGVSFTKDPKVALYTGQGDKGCPEFAWLDDYATTDVNNIIAVDVVYVINGRNGSATNWRGAVCQVIPRG